MIDDSASLQELRAHFRATSTSSMPIAGMIAWGLLGIVALGLTPQITGTLALYIMALIMPLAIVIDRLRGRNFFASGTANPLQKLFLTSIVGIAVTVPLVVIGGQGAGNPTLVVLGMAILAGVIWIPYGWAADDPVGLRHAVARSIGCYLAYAFAPEAYRATAICAVVVFAYLYSLAFMRHAGATKAQSA